MPTAETTLPETDLADLRRAKRLLEHPGVAIRAAALLGRPVEWGLARLPARANELVAAATRKAMERALALALITLDARPAGRPRDWLHRAAVVGTGAVGGAFGLPALAVELPVSTVVMLRSIADHARAQGEDLGQAEARLSCLVVFALGGRPASDDASEVGYFAVRAGLAKAVGEAVAWLAQRTAADALADRTAPALARLAAQVAARFAPAVAEKVAAQLVPVAGALGGAAINTLFLSPFQEMAWGHFTVRRLELLHGAEAVRAAYDGA